MSDILFIGIKPGGSLEHMEKYINRLAGEITPTYIYLDKDQDLTTKVMELESIVKEAVRRGYKYIGLPSDATVLRGFLSGMTEGLNGSVGYRWPGVEFMVQSAQGQSRYPNVHGFKDTSTAEDSDSILTQMARPGGHIHIIHQDTGTAASLTNSLVRKLKSRGIPTTLHGVSNNGKIDTDLIKQAVGLIEGTSPTDARSVIAHVINSADSEEYTKAALEGGLFDELSVPVIHYTYGNEYRPSRSVPVDMHYGRIPLIGVPSEWSRSIGIPINPREYYSFPYALSYLDSYLWAATKGRTSGINDKQLVFDENNTRLAYYIADVVIPRGTTKVVTGPKSINPAWVLNNLYPQQ